MSPDEATRARLLEHFLAGRPLAADVDVAVLAAATSNATPADLRAACADAAGIALARGRDDISQEDLREAIERRGHVLPVPEEPSPLDAAQLRRVCVHVAGHALVGAVLHGPDRLTTVEVGPDAGTVEFDGAGSEDDLDEGSVRDRIAVLMAGFGAERVVLGSSTLAHGSDIRTAGRLARDLVGRGLVHGVPPIDLDEAWVRGTATRDRLVDMAAALAAEARERAAAVLGTHREALAQVTHLLEEEARPRLAADTARRPVAIHLPALRAELARLLHASSDPVPAPVHAGSDAAQATASGRLN